jgi:membrane fusion protein
VLRISRSALSSGEISSLVGNAQAGEPHYRIVVSLDRPTVLAFGREESLKPGMLLDADILGEQRKLWEWAIEPLFALTGVTASD